MLRTSIVFSESDMEYSESELEEEEDEEEGDGDSAESEEDSKEEESEDGASSVGGEDKIDEKGQFVCHNVPSSEEVHVHVYGALHWSNLPTTWPNIA